MVKNTIYTLKLINNISGNIRLYKELIKFCFLNKLFIV